MKYSHTMIRVKDIEKSLTFYQNILGLKILKTMELKDATLYFITDEEGCCSIELTYNHQLPEGGYSHGNYFGHLAFETNDMEKFTTLLKSNDLDYTRPPFEIKPGVKIAFINDPDGITIEIVERK